MKLQILRVLIVVAACIHGLSSLAAADCEADGELEFLCGPVSPEDLAPLPDSPWIIAAGMENEGYLYLLNSGDLSTQTLYPVPAAGSRHDTTNYSSCPGIEPNQFRPHGLNLRPGADGIHTLYVVRHGAREAIEVFEVDARGTMPKLLWVGCVLAPESVVFNSVVALPEGGFAATHFQLPNGLVYEWHSGDEWTAVPGSESSGPNGIEVSADGRWFYIGEWGNHSFIRLSRGRSPVQKESVNVGHHIDNLRWAPDGRLFAAGHFGPEATSIMQCLRAQQCAGVSSRVSVVNPETMQADEIISYPSNEFLILGTVAIQVDDEIWVGGIAGSNRIARFPSTGN